MSKRKEFIFNITIENDFIEDCVVTEENISYIKSVLESKNNILSLHLKRFLLDICKHKTFNYGILKLNDMVILKGIVYQVIEENQENNTVLLESLTDNPSKLTITNNSFIQIIK